MPYAHLIWLDTSSNATRHYDNIEQSEAPCKYLLANLSARSYASKGAWTSIRSCLAMPLKLNKDSKQVARDSHAHAAAVGKVVVSGDRRITRKGTWAREEIPREPSDASTVDLSNRSSQPPPITLSALPSRPRLQVSWARKPPTLRSARWVAALLSAMLLYASASSLPGLDQQGTKHLPFTEVTRNNDLDV